MAGLDIAREIGLIEDLDYQNNQQEAVEISVMLKGLQRSLKQNNAKR